MIKIDEAGEISRKHYRKTANRGLTLNFLSHHASAIKRAIVNNELQRAYDYSTVDNRTSAVQEAKKKLSNNNYLDNVRLVNPRPKTLQQLVTKRSQPQ